MGSEPTLSANFNLSTLGRRNFIISFFFRKASPFSPENTSSASIPKQNPKVIQLYFEHPGLNE